VWARRALNEALSVDLAQKLRATASRLELADVVHGALARLEEDEARHALLASAVVQRLGGTVLTEAGPEPDARAEIAWMRLVLTGLCVCESVSAARFAMVRTHTDLLPFRACIEAFHRDELAHAELGFVLLPHAIALVDVAEVVAELRHTFAHLARVVGLGLARDDVPEERPQPTGNPGVVEPALDAIAFHRAMELEIVPRLERLGVPAERTWHGIHVV
jgi:hypothetical protein